MQRFKVVNRETGQVEYDLQFEEATEGKNYQMFRSNSPTWSRPGESVMSACDTGNSINFNKSVNTAVDYSDFAELLIMYSFIHAMDKGMMEEYNIVREEILTSI